MIDSIIESLGLGELLVDATGQVLELNGHAEQTLGVTDAQNNISISNICPELSVKNWRKLYNSIIIENQQSRQLEYLNADNTIFDARTLLIRKELNIKLIFNDQTQGSDEVMDMIRTSVEQIDDMIYWVRPNGTFAFTNQAVSRKLGYSQEELNEMSVIDIDPGFTPEAFIDFFEQLKKSKNMEVESKNFTKDGRKIDILASSTYIVHRELAYCCVVIKDITRQKRINRQLEEMKFAIDNAVVMCIWTNDEGHIEYVNQLACRKYQFIRDELIGKHLSELSATQTYDEVKMYSDEISDSEDWDVESEHIKKDGTLFPVEIAAAGFDTGDRKINIFFISDITKRMMRRKKAEALREEIIQLKDQLQEEKEYLQEELALDKSFQNIISVDQSYKQVLNMVQQVAETDSTVLITGETGTGKELLARAVHQISKRSHKSLIKVNCATLPKELIESELFGHKRGSFTGAFEDKKGKFELAANGTIFLDEIGELPLDLQPKLLRILQEGEYEVLGDPMPRKVDVRVIAATNRDLLAEVKNKRFREDLYYRLNVFPIHNIPLRERPNDIPILVQYFTEKYCKKIGKTSLKVKKGTISALMRYSFPGNVRELENMIERSVIVSNSTTLRLDHTLLDASGKVLDNSFPSFEDMQRDHILKALEKTRWKITGQDSASELLEINGKTLASKMRKLNISRYG